MKAIVMTAEFWENSMLSIARYYGQVKVGGHKYIIVDKRGRDIYECSEEAEKAGRAKAIEPGEPADLCRQDFIPIYRKLGRDKFFRFLEQNPDVQTVKAARERLKIWEQKQSK